MIYKKIKNKVTNIFKLKRSTYIRSKIEESKNSVKLWNFFNEITNFRKEISFPITKLVDKNGQDVIALQEL